MKELGENMIEVNLKLIKETNKREKKNFRFLWSYDIKEIIPKYVIA